MAKIKIFALGGLNEDGKNMYSVKVDNDIFIFDAGLKYPKDRMLGIDYIIPNYDYIKNNINNIKGIFLSHGHESNIGAINDMLMDIPNIPIYGSEYTMEILKLSLQDDGIDISNLNLYTIKPHQSINFGINSIFPISVTHSIPGSFAYILYTEDGSIVYTGDFMFDPAQTGNYKTDIGKLAYVGKQGCLCLLSESLYAGKLGFTSPNHITNQTIKKVFNDNKNRIIMSVLPAHIYRLQEIFDEVSKTHRKLIIMGKKLQKIINMSIDLGYLKINKTKIGDLSNLKEKDCIILVSDEKEKPFNNIEKILKGNDKYIELLDTDTIFITEPMYIGVEKRMVTLMDEIAMKNINVICLDQKKNLAFHPSREDLMMMINLMNPKYYFPVKGEYKEQYQNGEIAEICGIPKENILLKQNGDIVEFNKGNLVDNNETIKIDEVLIDGKSQEDVGELVLKDRELLAESGIVIVCATLDRETKEIIGGPEILTRGFIYVQDNADILKESQIISEQVIKNNIIPGRRADYNQIKQDIRESLGKYLYQETECKPLIISVIQEV